MDGTPRSTLRVDRKAFLPVVAPFPFACFAGALVTDLAYWQSPDAMWETFSIWLIFAGIIMAGVATLAALIDFAPVSYTHLAGASDVAGHSGTCPSASCGSSSRWV